MKFKQLLIAVIAMNLIVVPVALAGHAAGGVVIAPAVADSAHGEYTQEFRLEDCTFANRGRNPFFVLEPRYWLRLEGVEGRDRVDVTITVLEDTQSIDGVETRVVEERELVNGELEEVSRNFFAICTETNNVVYLGEDVDIDDAGVVVSHEGAWRAGVGGARPGLIMPGTYLLGSMYFQEIAPDIAMDRGLNTAMNLTEVTPAGSFSECVEVFETTPLEPSARSTKAYCPGIGLVRDDELRLVDWRERP